MQRGGTARYAEPVYSERERRLGARGSDGNADCKLSERFKFDRHALISMLAHVRISECNVFRCMTDGILDRAVRRHHSANLLGFTNTLLP